MFEQIESEVSKILDAELEVGNSTFYVDRLVPYLDANLETLNSRLENPHFDKLLMLISQRVLHTLHNSVCKDIEVLLPFICLVQSRGCSLPN